MPKQQKREYTQEQRDEAVSLYAQVGQAEASRQLKIPGPTIQSWAQAAGVRLDSTPPELKKARDTAVLVTEARKLAAAAKLFDLGERLLERAYEQEVAYKGTMATQVIFDEASPESVKNLMDAAAKAFEKGQLLSGGVTNRSENVTAEDFNAKLEELANEYKAKQMNEAKDQA